MNLKKTIFAAFSVLLVTVVALASAQRDGKGPVSKEDNTVAKHFVGSWKLDGSITRRLDPDRKLVYWDVVQFTNDPTVMDSMKKEQERLNITEVFASGKLIANGADYPYILYSKFGTMVLVWFAPSKTDPSGTTAVSRVINMILAQNEAKDLLFLGGAGGKRDAGACFKRMR